MQVSVTVFDAVIKIAVISFLSLNVTQKQYRAVQLKLIQHHIKFHPDQLKRVRENEAKKFCFALNLWPPAKVKVSESGIKW